MLKQSFEFTLGLFVELMLFAEFSSEVNRSVSFINYDPLLLTCAQVHIDKEKRWIFIVLFLLCELILLLRWLGWNLFSV